MKSIRLAQQSAIDDTPVRRLVRPISAQAFFRGEHTEAALAVLFRQYIADVLALPAGDCRAAASLSRTYQTRLDALTIFAQ